MTAPTRDARVPTLSQRWFARLWSWIDDSIDREVATAKEEVLRNLPGQIVEIGAGRGSNLKRYARGTKVIAYEPNPFMHAGLRAAAAEHGIELDLRSDGVEDIDLDDASQDAVVSTFTLCSVGDTDNALAQIQRILKPGGRFLFVEHIAAVEGSPMARAQKVLRRLWALLADKCDLVACTHHSIQRAGFTRVDSQIQNIGPRLDPSRRTVFGTAVR